jgi:DUF2993 family protein
LAIVRKLLITLLVLAGLLVVADFATRAYAEGQAGQVLQRQLHLSKKPSVSLGGFPFLIHAAEGSFSSIGVEATDVVIAKVPIQEVSIALHDVKFSLSGLLTGGKSDVSARAGDGSVALAAGAVNAIFKRQGVPVTVRFASGKVMVRSAQVSGEAQAALSIKDRTLVVRPEGGGPMFSVPLPKLVPGIRYRKAAVIGDLAVLSFGIERQAFKL